MTTTALKPDGTKTLQAALDEAGKTIPGCTLAVANADGVLFSGVTGPFDILVPNRKLSTHDLMWFASTTKLLTSICYLQLVDRGILALDTDMRAKFPALDIAASRIVTGFKDGKAEFEAYNGPITLLSLLNQSSGFGRESEALKRLQESKKAAGEATDKIDELMQTPLTFTPGSSFEYATSADWLGLIFPHITGVEMEEYFQEHILQPLGMNSTTFYPFGTEWEDRLMPLRFRTAEGEWVELTDQSPDLTYPRTSREDVDYPIGGGGIYSCSADYVLVLQNLLQHFLSLSGKHTPPKIKLISDESVASMFKGTLPPGGKKPMAEMLTHVIGNPVADGEADWSTAMAVYCGPGKEGERGGNSVQWGGIAGTQFWIDVDAGVAVVSSTNALSAGTGGGGFGKAMEKAVYAALER